MDSKGEESQISYPNIFFMIDSFEEVGTAPFELPGQSVPLSGRTPLHRGGGGGLAGPGDGSGLLPAWPLL